MTCKHNFLGESSCEYCGVHESEHLRTELERVTAERDDTRRKLNAAEDCWMAALARAEAAEAEVRVLQGYCLAHKEHAKLLERVAEAAKALFDNSIDDWMNPDWVPLAELRQALSALDATETARDKTAPAYNHTRGDSAETPCPLCAPGRRVPEGGAG